MPTSLHSSPARRVHVMHLVARDSRLPLQVGSRALTMRASAPEGGRPRKDTGPLPHAMAYPRDPSRPSADLTVPF